MKFSDGAKIVKMVMIKTGAINESLLKADTYVPAYQDEEGNLYFMSKYPGKYLKCDGVKEYHPGDFAH